MVSLLHLPSGGHRCVLGTRSKAFRVAVLFIFFSLLLSSAAIVFDEGRRQFSQHVPSEIKPLASSSLSSCSIVWKCRRRQRRENPRFTYRASAMLHCCPNANIQGALTSLIRPRESVSFMSKFLTSGKCLRTIVPSFISIWVLKDSEGPESPLTLSKKLFSSYFLSVSELWLLCLLS